MEENTIEEKAQKLVLAAIMKTQNCDSIKSAIRFASMNYTVYTVAMEAVRMAVKEFDA